jgi:hypothetical protein
MLKNGRTNVHDEERNGRPSCERRFFTFSELPCEFPQIPRSVLYEIITG